MTERPDPLESVLRAAFNAGEPVEDDGEALLLPADPDLPVPYPAATDDNAGKDTRKGASTLSSDILDLLAAIRDHVDVPLPGTDDADERAWRTLMYRRLTELHTSLDVALSAKWADTTDPADEAAYIRARTAATPVTYAVFESAVDRGEQA